jgi:hypothetical protein
LDETWELRSLVGAIWIPVSASPASVLVQDEPRVGGRGAPLVLDEIHAAERGVIPFVAPVPDATRPLAQAPAWLRHVFPAREASPYEAQLLRESQFLAFPQQACAAQSASPLSPWKSVILAEREQYAFQHRFETRSERSHSAFHEE